MIVLGIESSCDETGLALVEVLDPHVSAASKVVLKGEVLSSQVKLHELYGGVVPELAAREHARNIPILLNDLLLQSGISLRDIDAIGVTSGPGLKGCLLIGTAFALGLKVALDKPLYPINHIEGHILSGEMHLAQLSPPYLALVVSGGHTEIILVEGLGRYTCLARSRDDAAGEAFDKSANLLGLPYPGGAILAGLADSVSGRGRFSLPKIGREIDDFSFSGLKTAVSLMLKKHRDLIEGDPTARAEACWTIQDAIVDTLVHKTSREVNLRKLPLVVCGGVSANRELERRLRGCCSEVIVPPRKHAVDNGAMIAYLAARYFIAGQQPRELEIRSRWPVEELRG
jgi:N6-L-threonylcarbamoyladenine synthase